MPDTRDGGRVAREKRRLEKLLFKWEQYREKAAASDVVGDGAIKNYANIQFTAIVRISPSSLLFQALFVRCWQVAHVRRHCYQSQLISEYVEGLENTWIVLEVTIGWLKALWLSDGEAQENNKFELQRILMYSSWLRILGKHTWIQGTCLKLTQFRWWNMIRGSHRMGCGNVQISELLK